jgi:hypothetical protein
MLAPYNQAQGACRVCRALHPQYLSTKNSPAESVPVCSHGCEQEWLRRADCIIINKGKENNNHCANQAPGSIMIVLEFTARANSPLLLSISIGEQKRWSNIEISECEDFPKRSKFMFSGVLKRPHHQASSLTQRHKLHCKHGHARRNLEMLLPPRVLAELDLTRCSPLC